MEPLRGSTVERFHQLLTDSIFPFVYRICVRNAVSFAILKLLFFYDLPDTRVNFREIDIGRCFSMNMRNKKTISDRHELTVYTPSSYYKYFVIFFSFVTVS